MVSGAGLHQENTKGGNDIDGHSGMPDAKCDCQHLRSIPASRRTAPPPPPPPPRSGQKPLLAQTIRLPVIVLTPISGYHQPVLHHCFLSVSFVHYLYHHPSLSLPPINHADTDTCRHTDTYKHRQTQTNRHSDTQTSHTQARRRTNADKHPIFPARIHLTLCLTQNTPELINLKHSICHVHQHSRYAR